jgi:hypothetical protein
MPIVVETENFTLYGKEYRREGRVLRCNRTGKSISLRRARQELISLDRELAKRSKLVHEERERLCGFLDTYRKSGK